MSRSLPVALVCLLLAACGTQTDAPPADAPPADRCQDVIDVMSACFPDLAEEAICNAQTIAQFDRLGDDAGDCDAVDNLGKADYFAAGGCDTGEHVCGWLFCCADYVITWYPKRESDWDIVPTVQAFQAAAPAELAKIVEVATADELRKNVSVSFLQDVVESPSAAPVEMAVHITAGLVDVPYGYFQRALAAEAWGVELKDYLGGEVKVYERDEHGRATRQLERMVLRPFPLAVESRLVNNDMTKVEVIQYRDDQATVYWRVRYSNNNSTETDVGSVDFRRYDDDSTLVTFHSAHRLNAVGIHIANALVKVALPITFGGFVNHYQDRVEAQF